MTTIKERFALFAKSEKISQSKLEQICGFSKGYIYHCNEKLGYDKLKTIAEKFPHLNIAWLTDGIGPMYNVDSSESKSEESNFIHDEGNGAISYRLMSWVTSSQKILEELYGKEYALEHPELLAALVHSRANIELTDTISSLIDSLNNCEMGCESQDE